MLVASLHWSAGGTLRRSRTSADASGPLAHYPPACSRIRRGGTAPKESTAHYSPGVCSRSRLPTTRIAVRECTRYATSVWHGNWLSVGIGPVSNATQ